MEFELSVLMENAAFEDGGGRGELARILRKVADHVQEGGERGKILDVNGNRVGRWEMLDG